MWLRFCMENCASNIVKHEVLGFAEKLKPRILQKKKQFFEEFDGQMGEKWCFSHNFRCSRSKNAET